jgi:hypothetical protein
MAQAARDTGKKDAAALRLYSNSIVLFCVHYQPQTPLCSERRQSPHSRPLCEVQRKSAIRPLCRNVHGAASVTIGPERTFVDGAANDSSEPSLPTFCTAAKDRFREIAICSSVEPAQTGHSPTFGDAAVRPVNTDIRCNGKISPLANSQFADKPGLCRCSYCSSRAPRISGWPFAALQLISQKQSLKRARSTHPIAPSKYSTMLQ